MRFGFLVLFSFTLYFGLVTTGCELLRPVPPDPVLVAVPDFRATAAAVLTAGTESVPKPEPKPEPGVCQNCNGKGKLGDGTISVPCPVCGGDGRTDNELPKTAAELFKDHSAAWERYKQAFPQPVAQQVAQTAPQEPPPPVAHDAPARVHDARYQSPPQPRRRGPLRRMFSGSR
jgi:hypothetical protein